MSKGMKAGDRVSGVFWGVERIGTIRHIPKGQGNPIVAVDWDDGKMPRWCFAESLTSETERAVP